MEEEFLNLGLDIIGLGVFNYNFGSITTESPVIKARTARGMPLPLEPQSAACNPYVERCETKLPAELPRRWLGVLFSTPFVKFYAPACLSGMAQLGGTSSPLGMEPLILNC